MLSLPMASTAAMVFTWAACGSRLVAHHECHHPTAQKNSIATAWPKWSNGWHHMVDVAKCGAIAKTICESLGKSCYFLKCAFFRSLIHKLDKKVWILFIQRFHSIKILGKDQQEYPAKHRKWVFPDSYQSNHWLETSIGVHTSLCNIHFQWEISGACSIKMS